MTKRRTVTMKQFARAFKIKTPAVNKHILSGRLRAINVGNGDTRASWLIPAGEIARWKKEGYFPRKKMPVVVTPEELAALRHIDPPVNGDLDKQISETADRLLELIDRKLNHLSDLSELAARAKTLI